MNVQLYKDLVLCRHSVNWVVLESPERICHMSQHNAQNNTRLWLNSTAQRVFTHQGKVEMASLSYHRCPSQNA